MEREPHHSKDAVSIEELYEILVTGARPVLFQENEDSYIWGKGTLFIAKWGDSQFVITAKHVIENQGADYHHLRVLIPGYNIALPLTGASTPCFPNHEFREDVEDIFVWHIDSELNTGDEKLSWHAWKMDMFAMPAEKIETNQQLFAVGYPFIEDRFDYEERKIKAPPLIAIGKLSPDSIGKDIYTIDCDEFEVDLNGISGGPVFARFDGYFFYVGLIIRAGKESRKIHFINSSLVTFTLNEANKSC